jgi:hypothetical protein
LFGPSRIVTRVTPNFMSRNFTAVMASLRWRL